MKFRRSKVIGLLSWSLIFTFGMTFTVSAEEKSYAKEGVYVGVVIPYNTIGGEFDGENVLIVPDEVILVPKVESNYGWGIVLGTRLERGRVEVSYLRSTHDVTWSDAKGEATYNLINLDVNGFLTKKSLQPYVLLGLGIPWLVVKDGSATDTDVGDATFMGIGLNIGGGIAYYFHPRVSFSGGVVYRWISYGSAKGVGGTSRDIEDGLGGSGVNFSAGITFTF